MYDAIIVGARCAGSPTAMLLARAGYRVLLVDRDTFPSDTLSTAFMKPDAVQRMQRWGLYERFLATGVPVYTHQRSTLGPFSVEVPNSSPAMAPRRTYLDKLLVDAAGEAGAEVREAFSLQALLRDATGRVTGIRGQTADGAQVVEEARIVIGADGRNSAVARAVQAEEYDVVQPTSCGFYALYSGFEPTRSEIYLYDGAAFFVFPTHDGDAYIGCEVPLSHWQQFRADPESFMLAAMDRHAPELGGRVRAGQRTSRWFGMQGHVAMFRKPFGPGWALVGGAGYMKDPILGDGINDAFRDAELLARAIDDGFSGRRDLEEALTAYQAARDAAVKDVYSLTCDMAKLGPITPELMMRLGAAFAPPAGAPVS